MSDNVFKEQLQMMNKQLSAFIEMADAQGDHLLTALLCEAHDRVMTHYAELGK